MYSAVLFDLDGTLLNTLEDLGDAVNTVLTERGILGYSYEDYRYLIGEGISQLIKKVLPQDKNTSAHVEEAVKAFRQAYEINWKNKSRPYPGIPELLEELVERKIRIGVLSNKSHKATLRCVEGFFSKWPFFPVIGHQEGVPLKPDPTSAQAIAGQWNCSLKEILYVGDSGIDMETANRAGMVGVGVLWGFRLREELQEKGARFLLEEPQDLLKWFK